MSKIPASSSKDSKKKEPLHERLNIYQWSVVAIALWLFFGLVPIAMMQLVRLEDIAATRVSQFGAMFGAASAFFSGFALIGIMLTNSAQKKALELQKLELEEVADNQRKALNLQIILAFMDDIAADEFRQASGILFEYERAGALGRYGVLRHKTDRTPEEEAEFQRFDSARRRFVHVFHKMKRLHAGGAVDLSTVRTVFSPDLVWTLLLLDEPMEEAIRANYNHETFVFFQELYEPEEILGQWPRTPGNPLPTRLRGTAFDLDTSTQ
ncbi:hypothetical protein KUV46_09960 [Thalassovita mediterranea]|nr:hypothetical protein KUV46_09960 [Thalassovita mediterranea]